MPYLSVAGIIALPARMVAAAFTDEEIAVLIQKIQVYVFPRRIRVREFFLDFDKLRKGRVTHENFVRGLKLIGLDFSAVEVDALSDHFTEHGANILKPYVVNYVKFCQVIDECFDDPGAMNEICTSPTGVQTQPEMRAEERFEMLMHRLSSLCKSRGVVLRFSYMDCDRSPSPSPARTNHRMSGKVTRNQFVRNFPFKKEFTQEEVNVIGDHYEVDSGDIHFQLLHTDVSDVMSSDPPPFPRSDFIFRPDDCEWTQHRLSPCEKLRAKIVEKRVRISESFQDFDALRKGYCTVGQVKAVFTILNLSKEIDRNEFDLLINLYGRDDGMFNYRMFCQEVDPTLNGVRELHKDPLATIPTLDPETMNNARKSYRVMSPTEMEQANALEDKLRARVRSRRMNLLPTFKDMDRKHWNHVSRDQFKRVMYTLGFELDEAQIDLLTGLYCDMGNRIDFNYMDFIRNIDIPSEDLQMALTQRNAPITGREAHGPKQYFDDRGRVIPSCHSPILA